MSRAQPHAITGITVVLALRGRAVCVLIESHQYGSQVRPAGIRELGQSSKAEALVEALPGGEALKNNRLRSGGRKASK